MAEISIDEEVILGSLGNVWVVVGLSVCRAIYTNDLILCERSAYEDNEAII